MTNQTESVRRFKLNFGLEGTTPAYIMETEDDNYLLRGRLTAKAFGQNMRKGVRDVELLDTLSDEEVEEYSDGQVVEYDGEEWRKADLRLDTDVAYDQVDARILEYSGPGERMSVSVENEEVEGMAEEALKNFRGELFH
ncbi:hypothetical protein [Candidatus Nanohalovita haloferacivicina]|uniref:hypothetical protein n=1 Tax=Candidatus Nanohalovita haloferacivicina TaxID=2978046 RepID=UPI00325F9826|nr:hypothetical protein HBNXNv_1027 [Candidatus Nanohalobia archaeon BNXNv]